MKIDNICDMLKEGFQDVFNTMLNLSSETVPLTPFAQQQQIVAGSVGITGDVNGVVYIYIQDAFGKSLACRMLGLASDELEGDEMVNDVLGEISNMVAGAAKSRICDTGASVALTIPSIIRGDHFSAKPATNSESRVFAMRCEQNIAHVELIMKS